MMKELLCGRHKMMMEKSGQSNIVDGVGGSPKQNVLGNNLFPQGGVFSLAIDCKQSQIIHATHKNGVSTMKPIFITLHDENANPVRIAPAYITAYNYVERYKSTAVHHNGSLTRVVETPVEIGSMIDIAFS